MQLGVSTADYMKERRLSELEKMLLEIFPSRQKEGGGGPGGKKGKRRRNERQRGRK